MKLWTVQKNFIIDHIMKNGEYTPVFQESDYAKKIPKLAVLYDYLLESFNHIHGKKFEGLVFCFTGANEYNQPAEIPSYTEFMQTVTGHKEAVKSLWNTLAGEDVSVLELDIPFLFNPLYIDVNDFQFLMPPIMVLPPYTERSSELCSRILRYGIYQPSPLPSGLIQAHIPSICRDDIVKVHPMFSI